MGPQAAPELASQAPITAPSPVVTGPQAAPDPGPASGSLHDADPEIVPDPYLAAPPPPVRAGLSGLALASAVAWVFGPVGAILAIVFGHYARREIDASGRHRSGYALATTGMLLGVVGTLFWGGALSWFAWTLRYRIDPAGDEPSAAAPPSRRGSGPAAAPGPATPVEPGWIAPKSTKQEQRGAITVVDVGIKTSSLTEELARQRADATAAGEQLVVMTTGNDCAPCRGVDEALSDPLLQTALAKVRLVRVDIYVFHDDLEALKIPDDGIPGFFLPGPDLTPRDGVDGGEWDDDIPANIAPVLSAFVRGKYDRRRHPWHAVPPQGMTL
jgi:hypothetical protein